MSIFIDSETKVLVQGITGNEGSFWTKHMLGCGTHVVGGVTPGKAGQQVEGVPVFNTVRKAVAETKADASVLFVPPAFTKDAVFEALDAGIGKIVVTAEGVPVHDAMEIRAAALSEKAMVIGGNTSGVITPGKAMMGIFPYWIDRVYRPGTIGVMTRSGSLTNEVTAMAIKAGFGVSTLVGVGGDSVPCTRFAELLPLYEKDDGTKTILMIGELGGTMEEEVAEAIEMRVFTKPMVAFIAGRTAPSGKRMGHAGAIVSGGKGSVAGKIKALENVGVFVADRPSAVGPLMQKAVAK
ncbi:MAG: succinate--CoA ligase subunit alpha [Verrucomicrobia bacterium]|nr:succinate--CoA ligase subunit alpha [Verrucomicrobiota bacterium]